MILVYYCNEQLKLKTMATIIYNDNEHGDFVKCNNCGAIMLVPCGCEHCPECGAVGCLAWVDDEKQEADCDEVGEVIWKNVPDEEFYDTDWCDY